MSNESEDFYPFVSSLTNELDKLECGRVYFVIDNVSKDNTLELCNNLSTSDNRFIMVWSPENRNVVDFYSQAAGLLHKIDYSSLEN